MEAELDSLKVALEKAAQKPTRSSPRQKVIDKTKTTTTNQKAQIVAQQQKIERKQATLEKRKEYYETIGSQGYYPAVSHEERNNGRYP